MTEETQKTYLAIDLKSFYASVECMDRGLDPLTTNLVVADISRTEKTICLAVSPSLKALDIPGRARLYEVIEKAKNIDFIIAPPRIQRYIEISDRIYHVYNSFFAQEDIQVYSIDEVFIDATSYLKTYQKSPEELARTVIQKVLKETGITATAGIGTNLYLAKVAMDIEAKHIQADKYGVRVASLDEKSYREKLWDHTPLTDFWRIGKGISKRLINLGIKTMGDLANYSLTGSEKLYKEFGINAELIIDHAWGWEPTTIEDIKSYHSENHSLSVGQVLSTPYPKDKAKLILKEMVDQLTLGLTSKNLQTDQVVIDIIYDKSNLRAGYKGEMEKDFYGRTLPKKAHGTANLDGYTLSLNKIMKKTVDLFDKIVDSDLTIRKLNISANHVVSVYSKKPMRQLDIFSNYEAEKIDEEKKQHLQQAILDIKYKYGKNSIVRAMDLEDGATTIMRNRQVGGHRA